jgi:hypothetical protein
MHWKEGIEMKESSGREEGERRDREKKWGKWWEEEKSEAVGRESDGIKMYTEGRNRFWGSFWVQDEPNRVIFDRVVIKTVSPIRMTC